MNRSKHLLIRADVGPHVGTGHLMRTLALGQAWRRNGGDVTVVCGEIPRALINRIESEKFQLQLIRNNLCDRADSNETMSIITAIEPSWIVLDGYRFDDEYESVLKTSSSRISNSQLLALDDYQHAQHLNADLILNQNVYADLVSYRPSQRSKILAGPKFALLRDEFFKLSARKRTRIDARRLLVTFGGADPDNWTLQTLQALSELNRKRLVVDCVVGACYTHTRELDAFKKSANMNLRIHRNVDRMTTLMTRVDLAITAGGSTCYELARCGIPAVVVAIADNQIPVACAMDERGIMVSINGNSEIKNSGSLMGNTINQLLKDPDRRDAMSKRGQLLVDGRGAERIVEKMIRGNVEAIMIKEKTISEPKSNLLDFRDATMEDAKPILRWRNDPEVRSVSFHDGIIALKDHQTWMAQKLADTKTKIWISEDSAGRAIAQLRFDFSEDGQQAIISIIVDQALRGRGLGRLLITSSSEKIFANTQANSIIAYIKPGNSASERAFRAAGFRAVEPAIVNGKMALQYLLNRHSDFENVPIKKSA